MHSGITFVAVWNKPFKFLYEFAGLLAQSDGNGGTFSSFMQIAAKSLSTITSTAFFARFTPSRPPVMDATCQSLTYID